METITMPNSMNMAPLPHSHEADVSDVLSLFSDPSMNYMGLGSGNNMNIGLGLGSGSGSNIGLGLGSGSGMNVGLGMGSGNAMNLGLGSGSGPTLIISPANSTASSPSLSHLSRNGVVRERSRDSSSSLSSMDETLDLSPNTIANFLNHPGSRTSGGSDSGSGHLLSASPVSQTLVISPGSSLSQTLPIPTPVVLSPPQAPDPRVNSPPMKGLGNSANNAANGTNKKRKRPKVAEKTEVISNWETYYPPRAESFNLYNESQLDIMNTFDLDVKIDSGNAVYSEEDNAWIFYRQNQFQIVAELLGSLSNYTPKGTTTTTASSKKTSTSPTSISATSGDCILYVEVADYLRKVETLAMDVRIIKQSRNNLLSGIIEDDLVEDKANQVKIFKVGMSRTKKENKSVEAISFVQGKASQSKLQFQSATANNAKMQAGVPNPNQQYFRLVVSLVAKIYGSEDYLHVLSKLSPPIIVRGQSPGRYPHQNQTQETTNEWRPGSMNGEDVMTYAGKVGVNTSNPLEALTVHGNILVTGNIVKPSDVRLKSEFDEVKTETQLKNIEKLKIYDYNIKNPLGSGEKRERGVIAQEVQEAIPTAVQVLGDVTLENDTHVPNLLVVNDHVLLLENIGATKHLSELLKEEQENIKEIDSQLKDLEASTEESESVVTTKLLSVLDYIASEESLENQRHCYCSFFGLGPAWSLFLLGFVFTGITWIFGIFYICSTNHVKRVAGVANLIMAVVLVTYYIILGLYGFAPEIIIFTTAGLIAIGAICMLVMSLYGRRRSLERQAALRQIKNILIQRYTNANMANKSNSRSNQANPNTNSLSAPLESTPLLVKGSLADSDDSIASDDNV